MAEYVHQNLETMLPELEEMERLGIFNKQEIKCIVKRRTAFEYKLQRRIVQEADFLRYIQYELNLDLLRKRRKQKFGITKKVLPGEAVFIKRLHFVFQSALKKFSSDVKLWLQYIDYCKRMGSNQVLGKVVGRMLQAHPNNTGLWIMVAKWEFEDKKSIKSARSLMQRALRLNPNCCNLWLEYFRLELLHVDKVKKRRQLLGLNGEEHMDPEEPTSSDFLSGKTAIIVYKNATQSIPDCVEFRLKFVDIYNLFDGFENGLDEIYESLLQDFPNSEVCWNALANRSLNKRKASKINLSNLTVSEWCELETERNNVFEEAIKKLPTEQMWTYYIDASLGDLERYSGSTLKERVNYVLQLYKSADKAKKLTADMFLSWIETLLQNGNLKEAVKVCKSSLKDYPKSLSLWQQYFKMRITELGSFTSVLQKEFAQAVKEVDSCQDILPLWNLWLEHSTSLDISETENIFQQCISICSSQEVLTKIKEDYIELVILKEGITKGRKVYRRLNKEKPVSVSCYQKCITAERSQASPSLKHLQKLYETALEEFGEQTPGFWLDYLGMELEEGDLEMVGKLHWRAMKALSGDKIEEFVTKYTLLQHSLM